MENKPKKKIYKKWWFWVIVAVVLFGIIGSFGNSNKDKKEASQPASSQSSSQQAQVKTETKAPEPPKDDSIKQGMYKIGSDLQPGEYVVIASGNGYMELAKDSSGQLDSIIANENFATRTIVTVENGQYLTMKDAKAYPIDKAPKVEPKDGILGEGMYKVGVDLQPGEYKAVSDGSGYVEVAKDSKQTINSIISNDNFEGEKYVTVAAGQYLKLGDAHLKLK